MGEWLTSYGGGRAIYPRGLGAGTRVLRPMNDVRGTVSAEWSRQSTMGDEWTVTIFLSEKSVKRAVDNYTEWKKFAMV